MIKEVPGYYFKDSEGHAYNVEMQVSKKGRIEVRGRYYLASIDLDNLSKGADYDDLPDTIIIVLCCYDPFGKGDYIYRIKGDVLDSDNKPVGNNGTEYLFCNLKGTHGKISTELKEVFEYMNTKIVNNNFTEKIDKALEESKKKWRTDYMTMEMKLYDERKTGERKGEKRERKEIVSEMIKNGFSYETIKNCVKKLTDEEYREIKEELK